MVKKRKKVLRRHNSNELGSVASLALASIVALSGYQMAFGNDGTDKRNYDKKETTASDLVKTPLKFLGRGVESGLETLFLDKQYREKKQEDNYKVTYDIPKGNEQVALEDLESLEPLTSNTPIYLESNFPYDSSVFEADKAIKRMEKVYQLPESQRNQDTINLMTEVAFAEARSLYGDYKFGRISKKDFESYIGDVVASSVINRALDRRQTVKEVVTAGNGKVHAYSYRNKSDPNRKLVNKAYEQAKKNPIELEAYHSINDIVQNVVSNGTDSKVDHYFVRGINAKSNTFPDWAFLNGKLRTPVIEMIHYLYNKNTRKHEKVITRGYDID